MAWRCSGTSNEELIENMRRGGLINSDRVAAAMKKVDRAAYVPVHQASYEDSPQPIGYGATISAPHMHANAVETLLPFLNPGARVLDVGSGSGYLLGILHQLVQPGGKVCGIEHVQELVDGSTRALKKDGLNASLDDGTIKVICGDGRLGWKDEGPFDAIHVGAASPKSPAELINQLAKPGRLFVPIGTTMQSIYQIDKDEDGKVTEQKLYGVLYVPLTDKKSQY